LLLELKESAAKVVLDDLDSRTAECMECGVMYAQHSILKLLVSFEILNLDTCRPRLVPIDAQ
jgi:hypothetical protein